MFGLKVGSKFRQTRIVIDIGPFFLIPKSFKNYKNKIKESEGVVESISIIHNRGVLVIK
jgi:hypothetical protein